MNRIATFAGWMLVSLTVSTVAMAQQGGGGRGGDGGGNGGGGGDPSIYAVQRADFERARLSRPVERRAGSPNCVAGPCDEQTVPGQRVRARPVVDNACAGGDVYVLRSRSGQILRAYCEPW